MAFPTTASVLKSKVRFALALAMPMPTISATPRAMPGTTNPTCKGVAERHATSASIQHLAVNAVVFVLLPAHVFQVAAHLHRAFGYLRQVGVPEVEAFRLDGFLHLCIE